MVVMTNNDYYGKLLSAVKPESCLKIYITVLYGEMQNIDFTLVNQSTISTVYILKSLTTNQKRGDFKPKTN